MKTLKTDFLRLLFVLVVAAGACTAKAGPMYVYVVTDPITTAGAGVPASNAMTVSSTRSGPGTFHVYVVDDVVGSFGIRSFNIKLNGTITGLLNRSPVGDWDDANNVSNPIGFNDIRFAVASTGTVTAGQAPPNLVFIKGFGISASDFPVANPLDVNTTQVSSGQWGTYSTTLGAPTSGVTTNGGSGLQRNAILLAEGSYTGIAPTVDLVTPVNLGGTGVNVFNSSTGQTSFSVTQFSALNPFLVPEPATLSLLIGAVMGASVFFGRRQA